MGISRKKVTTFIASVLIFSIAGLAQAQAEEFSVTVTPDQTFVDFPVNGGGVYQIDVFRSPGTDPAVQLYRGNAPTNLNTTSDPDPDNHIAEDDDGGDDRDSRLTGTLDTDYYTIRVTSYCVWDNDCDAETETYTLSYTGFTTYILRTGNALRLDSAGTTTEKNNVVSCTPGKYTFLNGGSTAETAKVQSYVYTLLVNGKAVSTISSDNFKSVASHLFPTIAGNMAGTATLEGASWDLKGMSNYSAQCQVYAAQSGGNIQSVTTSAHDSVALAAQAEAAAKAQATKEMIANWAATNEELAKKYRDARLAGRP